MPANLHGYAAYLVKIVELTKRVMDGPSVAAYPKSVDTSAKRALYDNFIKNESFVAFVDGAVRAAGQDDWRSNPFKVKKVRGAIEIAVEMYKKQSGTSAAPMAESRGGKSVKPEDEFVDEILELVKNQHEY
jgi:type I restriction enzyme, R subunit